MARHSPLGPNRRIRVSPPGSASIDSYAQLVAEACVYRTKGLRSALTNLSEHNDGNHGNQNEQQGVLDEAGAFVIRREPVHELDHEVEHLFSPLSELSLLIIAHLVFAFNGSGDPKNHTRRGSSWLPVGSKAIETRIFSFCGFGQRLARPEC